MNSKNDGLTFNYSAAMQSPVLSGYSVMLEPVDTDTQALIFAWRNQTNVRQHMVNQQVISKAEHDAWFATLSSKKDQQHFVIYYKNQPIGAINIRCHDGHSIHDSQHAEIGLYIGEEKFRHNIIAFAPSLVINDYAFTQLKIKSLVSKVRADNKAALKYNQQLGYELSPEQQGFIEIKLSAINYKKHSEKLKNFLSRGN